MSVNYHLTESWRPFYPVESDPCNVSTLINLALLADIVSIKIQIPKLPPLRSFSPPSKTVVNDIVHFSRSSKSKIKYRDSVYTALVHVSKSSDRHDDASTDIEVSNLMVNPESYFAMYLHYGKHNTGSAAIHNHLYKNGSKDSGLIINWDRDNVKVLENDPSLLERFGIASEELTPIFCRTIMNTLLNPNMVLSETPDNFFDVLRKSVTARK